MALRPIRQAPLTLAGRKVKLREEMEGKGNTNVGGRTDKTLTEIEGRVWRSGEDENLEVGGGSRQSTKGDERKKPEDARSRDSRPPKRW
jgi:hypothetical protein